MQRQANIIISAVAVSLVALSVGAENPPRPIGLNPVTPTMERAVQVNDTVTASSIGTNAVTDADNTARNVRDRNDATLTPFDQGNSKADVDTTAQIRKGILASRDMSVNAKNVKIITNNGRVTLRGPVQSEEEKRLIGEIANRIAQSENVDNQLEVTLKTTSN